MEVAATVTTMLLILVALLTAALGLTVGAVLRPSWLRRSRPALPVIVHTRDDQSLKGVQVRRSRDGILLGAPELVPEDGPPMPLAGQTWVPMGNVRFLMCQPIIKAKGAATECRPYKTPV